MIRWAQQGKVWRLRRGLYTLPDSQRTRAMSLRWLANRLYSPSYISLDTVLSFYDLIPERVTVTMSVCIAKTASFENPLGTFVYHSIKPKRFFGFEEISDENGVLVRMATPEKALLDRIYLDTTWRADLSYFEENLRLQNLASLKMSHIKSYARQFDSTKINQAMQLIIQSRRAL